MVKSGLEVETTNNLANSSSYPLIRIMYSVNQLDYPVSFARSFGIWQLAEHTFQFPP